MTKPAVGKNAGEEQREKPLRQEDSSDFLKERACFERKDDVRSHLLRTDELRVIIRQKGFRVKSLAVHIGLDVRTLERHFDEQFRMRPKAWIMRERMSFAPPHLAEGHSNKQVAASLSYTCESNSCRDFKRYFGRASQEFARSRSSLPPVSRFDKELSRFDKRAKLPWQSARGIL